MSWWAKLRIDTFLVAIIVAAVVATFAPASGVGAEVLTWAIKVLVFALFFLYGSRLSPQAALEGLTHWRLHLVVLSCTFVLFPLVGLALGYAPAWMVPPALYPGLLFASLCPGTVQSAINFTSIARGNVAGAIVSSSISNLLGVVLTPLLAIALLNTTGHAKVGLGAVFDLMVQILLPFVLGQLSRPWTADFVTRHKKLKYVDQASIVLVVYSAFSQGVREGIWSIVGWEDLLAITVVCVVLLVAMFTLTWFVAGRLGFSRADRIALQMCGTKKSLATGLPMATVMFAGQPIGLLILPLMVFHQAQLMMASWLATRHAHLADEGA